jgi:Uma2 family endonuclease
LRFRRHKVREKTEDWLSQGCHEVWLIDPQRNSASVCTFGSQGVQVEVADTLTTDLLPGFALPVAELFQ